MTAEPKKPQLAVQPAGEVSPGSARAGFSRGAS